MDLRDSKRRILGDLGAEAKKMKAEALRAKYAPKPPLEDEEEEAALSPAEGEEPLEEGMEAAVEGEPEVDPVEEARAALAALTPEEVQELLATLKKE